jgi:DNA-binding LacI/PurR family transcriptional regulator
VVLVDAHTTYDRRLSALVPDEWRRGVEATRHLLEHGQRRGIPRLHCPLVLRNSVAVALH